MNCSTPGLPVHHQVLEFTQTHVHWVSPSHPLSSPSPPPRSEPFPMSQLFASGGQSIGVSALASFLSKNTQGWSPLEWTDWISLQSKGLSRVFSNTTVPKHQFFGTQLSLRFNYPGGASGKEPACQCKRHKRYKFSPWVGKISWRRIWQPTPVFLPGESHGQRSLGGYGP